MGVGRGLPAGSASIAAPAPASGRRRWGQVDHPALAVGHGGVADGHGEDVPPGVVRVLPDEVHPARGGGADGLGNVEVGLLVEAPGGPDEPLDLGRGVGERLGVEGWRRRRHGGRGTGRGEMWKKNNEGRDKYPWE